MRIYDKKQEQQDNTGEVINVEQWVRWELELTDSKAMQVALLLYRGKPLNLVIKGILSAHYCFKTKPKNASDLHNKDRLTTMKWWNNFISNADKIPLKITRDKITFKQKKNWVENTTSKSISMLHETYRRVYGEEFANAYIKEILIIGKDKITEYDKSFIEQKVLELSNKDEY